MLRLMLLTAATRKLGQDCLTPSSPWLRTKTTKTLDDDEEVEAECQQLLPDETRIWAPDHIVAQLTGRFNDCKRFADVPRPLRAAPDAKTWAGVQLWLWWLPPTSFGDGGRVVCRARVATVWATMLGGFRAEMTGSLPALPEELWLYMFGFLKHDQQPTFPTEDGGSEDASEDGSEDGAEDHAEDGSDSDPSG